MGSRWRLAVTAAVLLGGCPSQGEPTAKLGSERVRVEATDGPTDPFGLPLVIVLQPPPVPKEIEGPSPPIQETPKDAPKKASPKPFNLGLLCPSNLK